jgi:translation initiation factor IF-2
MSEVTVKELAEMVGMTAKRLLTQLKNAGMAATSADQVISDKEKRQLLKYLQQGHAADDVLHAQPKKISLSLKRKPAAEVKTPVAKAGRNTKTVSV